MPTAENCFRTMRLLPFLNSISHGSATGPTVRNGRRVRDRCRDPRGSGIWLFDAITTSTGLFPPARDGHSGC